MLENNDKKQDRSSFAEKASHLFRTLGSRLSQGLSDLAADDYSDVSLDSPQKRRPKTLQVFLAGSLIGAFAVIGVTSYFDSTEEDQVAQLIQERAAEEPTLTPIASVDLPMENMAPLQGNDAAAPEQEAAVSEIVPDNLDVFTLNPRENLATVLKKAGLTNQEIHKISTALEDILDLKKIQVGDKIEVGSVNTENDGKALMMVTIEDRRGYRYTALRNDEDFFEANLTEPKVELKMEYAEGTIDGAFIVNAKNAGVPTNVIQQIIWAFDGPVDFQRDLRRGDSFKAVFNKEYNMEGNPTGNGELLYASFDIRNKVHERYLYKDSNDQTDFYDENGKIARKLFTMHPLRNPRQTSRFGMRKHPILGYTTMHWGADYGAPVGTPIRAPGEGTITSAGKRGSYGHYVQIRHNSEYSTAYAHMSRINEKIRVGRKVKAGEVIGYVGNTGRSTGPHLHWELIKNNRKINPTTQKITAQKKLTGTELQRFHAARDRMRTDLLDTTAIARAEPLPEDRKQAYQGPQKKKKARKARVQKTASRRVSGKKG
ncbi:MAG: peptidoglycan DD-metalloendopeptidase family protein [Alphaproteobacteria bacterium]